MMFKYGAAVLAAGMLIVSCKSNETVNANASSLATAKDSISYALGVSIGENLKSQGIEDIDESKLAAGMRAQLDGDSLFPLEDADTFIRAELQRRKEAKELAAKQDGIDFLEANKTKEGVVVLESGLQYKMLVEGEGTSPLSTQKVKVHYEGKLIDGTIFESSYQNGRPAEFFLNQVIPGWTEGVQYLKPGGKAEFYIPQELAYGARPRPGGPIPPYAALIFTIELLEILPDAGAPQQ